MTLLDAGQSVRALVLEQPKIDRGKAVDRGLDRARLKAQPLGAHVQDPPQIDLALPDPVADLAAVKLGELGTCELAPGLPLKRHQDTDFATQNVGLVMSSDLLFEKNPPLPISPANCLKMVNESLTRGQTPSTPPNGRCVEAPSVTCRLPEACVIRRLLCSASQTVQSTDDDATLICRA